MNEPYALYVDYADGHREIRRLTPEQAADTDIDCMAGDLNPSDWHPDAEVTNFYVAVEECPAGGPHRYESLTTYDMGPGRPEATGFYCIECHTPAPGRDDL